jgi:hypothetical protein
VIESGGATVTTVIDSDFEADCCGVAASVTVSETLNVPAVVGVPAMSPVDALIERPAGNPLADQLYGV